MYLEHFGFSEFPFSLTPNLRFFCTLNAYKEALNVIMVSLHNKEGFVKITGEVGTGKTLICRKLLNSLGDEYVTAYIANAISNTLDLQKAIAHELEIEFSENIDNHRMVNLLTNKLIELHNDGKRVVVIIDEAHTLSDQTLEGLRLLSNLETESSKLMQIALVGQPELDRKLKKSHLRQLQHRIIFSYRLPTLHSEQELLSYICFRLSAAGYRDTYDALFSPKAIKLLLKASRGIPRLINILCHKSFLIAYGYNQKRINTKAVKMAIADTDSVSHSVAATLYYHSTRALFVLLSILTIIGVGSYFIMK